MARADLYFHDPQPNKPNHWRPATIADFSSNGGQTGNSFTTTNLSGAIAVANIPQDLAGGNAASQAAHGTPALAAANPNRDRITIQNLDSTDILLIGIGEDAVSGRAYEIDPRGSIVIDQGEADKRISVMSAKVGLKFVAIGVVRS